MLPYADLIFYKTSSYLGTMPKHRAMTETQIRQIKVHRRNTISPHPRPYRSVAGTYAPKVFIVNLIVSLSLSISIGERRRRSDRDGHLDRVWPVSRYTAEINILLSLAYFWTSLPYERSPTPVISSAVTSFLISLRCEEL
jgi:hypothetical protein